MKNIFPCFLLLVLPVCFLSGCKKYTNSSASANSNAELITKLKAVSDSVMGAADLHIPGMVALVVDKNKGIDWLYTAGVSDIPDSLPMNSDFTFRIGSNTKTMTGTVLLQLVDEGKLKLEDTLSKFFPSFPGADSITIRMLCNMTSGYISYSDIFVFVDSMIKNPTNVWLPMELLNYAFEQDTIFCFPVGTGFHYSNTNTIILGLLIEKLTGTSLQTQVANRIATPLGLQHTGLLTSGVEFPGPHSKGYYFQNYIPGDDYTTHFDISWAWAAGSAYSNPRELQKYVEALVGGSFLSASLQQQRLTEMRDIGSAKYGLCLFQRGSFYGHNGGCPGFTSSMYHSLQRNCTVILYFNCQLSYIPDNLFLRYVNILYGAGF